jgi:hypothetical protein
MLFTSDFKSEKELEKFIVSNIDNFAKDILNDTLENYCVNKSINDRLWFSPRGRSVDLYIK